MEDRTESILKHGNLWDAYLKHIRGREPSIHTKIKYIIKRAEQRNTILNKYFSDDLLNEILSWKDERNTLIHVLMKQSLTTEKLESLAIQGKNLARTLTNRSSSYRRAIEKIENT